MVQQVKTIHMNQLMIAVLVEESKVALMQEQLQRWQIAWKFVCY
jgi:hypothetical protein